MTKQQTIESVTRNIRSLEQLRTEQASKLNLGDKKMSNIPNAVTLILSDARGIYIPRAFVTDNYNEVAVDHCAAWGIDHEDADILASGPDHEFYWETWEDVLNYAQYTDEEGNKYFLSQDGDLWAFCYERMTEKEKSNFGME